MCENKDDLNVNPDDLEVEDIEDADLEDVAGGHYLETREDANELYKRGLIGSKDAKSAEVRTVLHRLGYKCYSDKGGIINHNRYGDKNGRLVTRDQFWANFDRWQKNS